jgi:predicted O-methyltransferase YrrM
MKTIVSKIPSRDSLLLGEGALEIGYPWLTYGAIIALEHIVNKDMKVLEFGSGGSTIFWARNCKSVKSFDTDPEWVTKVKKTAEIQKLKNVEVILATQEETITAVNKEPDNYYDLVLVDSTHRHNRRLLFANASIPKLKQGGWLVADNYWRFSMNDFDYSKWRVYTFDELNYQGKGTRLCQKK